MIIKVISFILKALSLPFELAVFILMMVAGVMAYPFACVRDFMVRNQMKLLMMAAFMERDKNA